jgi:hypothetical protein
LVIIAYGACNPHYVGVVLEAWVTNAMLLLREIIEQGFMLATIGANRHLATPALMLLVDPRKESIWLCNMPNDFKHN